MNHNVLIHCCFHRLFLHFILCIDLTCGKRCCDISSYVSKIHNKDSFSWADFCPQISNTSPKLLRKVEKSHDNPNLLLVPPVSMSSRFFSFIRFSSSDSTDIKVYKDTLEKITNNKIEIPDNLTSTAGLKGWHYYTVSSIKTKCYFYIGTKSNAECRVSLSIICIAHNRILF